MLLIPAIDLKDGKCVRLRQGRMDEDTVYSDDPVAMAEHWVETGARRLHIVDLNGAIQGRPVNIQIIRRIAERLPKVPIQVGGGIRNEDTIQTYLEAGVSYTIIGTKAVTTPHFVADMCLEFPGHIIVGLDIRDGKLAIEGWSKLSHNNVVDLAHRLEQEGVAAFIHTDISRDGMMNGPNIEATVDLARTLAVPVFASGGITSLNDIRALCEVAHEGIEGAIIGRAIYEGRLDFRAAQRLADEVAATGAN
ncbi:MAG TPA: 1-(5-phosphoribosyl)-5-[(5-phosphoribosylamino)methylideneamino]imidazole-4-carboxamide isomerase [Gammaproteobacteria bacterium]|nr:1-(5-phosphoribosyl)-5-[(5-phosphoribosylamino)methylideneamino]imidazole-4-carboxamide isomerase [Gammaproteobacteria bacterium]